VQAERLKQFVSKQRKHKGVKDGKAEWLLEHRTLTSQAASLEEELEKTIQQLHADGILSDEWYRIWQDDALVAEHLLCEEASESKEAAQQLRCIARMLRADWNRAEADVDDVLQELAKESEQQWRAVRSLEEDVASLTTELRCAIR
jgi:hypothetical protein